VRQCPLPLRPRNPSTEPFAAQNSWEALEIVASKIVGRDQLGRRNSGPEKDSLGGPSFDQITSTQIVSMASNTCEVSTILPQGSTSNVASKRSEFFLQGTSIFPSHSINILINSLSVLGKDWLGSIQSISLPPNYIIPSDS
jgi:hypothetical protein